MKIFELRAARICVVMEKCFGGGFEDLPFERYERSKIYKISRKFRSIVQNRFCNPSLCRDRLEAKEKGVSAHARQTLIRGVSVAGRSEGEDLPQALAGSRQEIDKPVGRVPKVTNSVAPR